MTADRNYTVTPDEALALHKLVDDHMFALKNWMAMYVENGNLAKAQELCKELRFHERMFAKLNVKVHREIAARDAAKEVAA